MSKTVELSDQGYLMFTKSARKKALVESNGNSEKFNALQRRAVALSIIGNIESLKADETDGETRRYSGIADRRFNKGMDAAQDALHSRFVRGI